MKASAFKVDLDFSAFDESFDQDVDENDPELLEELAALSGLSKEALQSMNEKNKKQHSPKDITSMELPELNFQSFDDEIDVELTEDDFHNEELLNALNELNGGEEIEEIEDPLKNAINEFGALSIKQESAKADATNYNLLMEKYLLRQSEYKTAAVEMKREGNIEIAKEFLRVAKSIEEDISILKQSSMKGVKELPEAPVKVSSKPVSKPQSVQIPKQIVKKQETIIVDPIKTDKKDSINSVQASPKAKEEPSKPTKKHNPDDVKKLKEALNSQIEKCTANSAYYLKKNQKDEALKFHKWKKSLVELNNLIDKAVETNDNLPQLTTLEVSFEKMNVNSHLKMNEMECKVIKLENMSACKEFDINSEICVRAEIPWPSDDQPFKLCTKGVKKNENPSFDQSFLIKIDRSKAFQRFVERKKISIEVCQVKGFLIKKSVVIGRCNVLLSSLNSKSSVSASFDLTDGFKKSTGGRLHFSVSLLQPLLSPDISKVNEKWFLPLEEQREEKQQIIEKKEQSKTESKKSKDMPASIKEKKSVDVEDLESDFNDVSQIASNLVLENEMQLIDQQIAALTAKKCKIPDDLIDRKQALEIKMNLLVVQVQSGSLTMESYLMQVKKAIEFEKERALKYKAANSMDLAKKALLRVKMMQQEVDEVEQSQ